MESSDDLERILRILERDGRTPPEKVAEMLGLSPEQVRELIEQAERDKILLKYKAVVNWDRAGRHTVQALIEVRVVPERGVGFDAVAERIYRFPEVRSLWLLSGAYDLAVIVTGANMHDVAGFVSEKLAPIDHVSGTVTHFLLKRFKEEGEILEGREDIERLAVTP